MEKKNVKTITTNKKARHDYYVLETAEAGIELTGTEVKSLRNGGCNLRDCYCEIRGGEIYVIGMHISPYHFGNIFNPEPMRDRRLLMHKKEIDRLHKSVSQKGLTIVPLSLYLSGSYVKVEVALCKGKKLYDKREAEAEREAERNMEKYSKADRKWE